MRKSLSKTPVSRMCCVCRAKADKALLLRVVKKPDGEFAVDEGGRADGRGAYICKTEACLAQAVKKKAFNRSFKCNIPDTVYARVREIITPV